MVNIIVIALKFYVHVKYNRGYTRMYIFTNTFLGLKNVTDYYNVYFVYLQKNP